MAIGEGTLSSSAPGWVDFGVLKLALCGCQFHEPLAKETPEVSEPKANQVHFLSIPDFLSMLDRPPTITDHHRPLHSSAWLKLHQANFTSRRGKRGSNGWPKMLGPSCNYATFAARLAARNA